MHRTRVEPNARKHRRTLARRGSFAVELCACGQVHVTIGRTTLRLAPEEAASLSQVMAEGLARTRGRRPEAVH